MDELGFNKIAAAVLATGLGVMGLINAPKVFIKDHYPATPAYSVGELEKPTEGDAEPLPFPQAEWVGAMDAAKGAKVFNKCKSCHNANNGGANGTGPNLYNILGNAAAAKSGFSYSGAMAGSGVTWSYEALDGFLTKPSKYMSGTKMSFIGLKKAEDRAAIIEYLRLASDAPIAPPVAAGNPAEALDTEVTQQINPEIEVLETEILETETPEIETPAPTTVEPTPPTADDVPLDDDEH
ncbi:MAG: cytochrome c family protein [Litorimonas sp.]